MTKQEAQINLNKWETCTLCGGVADAVRDFGASYHVEDWEPCCIDCFVSTEPYLIEHYQALSE
jgi:hypothetical protein